MATAVSATGKGKTNSLDQWEEITIRFDDGTKQVLPNVNATLRQIHQLAVRPQDYRQILGVNDG